MLGAAKRGRSEKGARSPYHLTIKTVFGSGFISRHVQVQTFSRWPEFGYSRKFY